MPSRENHRGNDHPGKRAIALYKATLALETMLGKQAGTTRTRIRHLPIRLRRAMSQAVCLGEEGYLKRASRQRRTTQL